MRAGTHELNSQTTSATLVCRPQCTLALSREFRLPEPLQLGGSLLSVHLYRQTHRIVDARGEGVRRSLARSEVGLGFGLIS